MKILITDTHFGVKQNSMTWFNSQLDFIYNQLIPYLKKQTEYKQLIHLGDVFDSRSTISTYIANKVIEVFKELRKYVDEFIIVGGNHDFYSPNSDSIDTINLLLNNLDIRIITKECYVENDCLYVPWYKWLEHIDGGDEIINLCKQNNIKNIFTHADIVHAPINISGVNVYSGHTHTPYIKGPIKNLGSCYALDFGDSNSSRGFYILSDKLQFIENNYSIKFHRLYNEEIFGDKDFGSNDYIELYISQNNMIERRYIDIINQYTKLFKHIWIIPQVVNNDNLIDEKIENYDIEALTREMIPEELKDKFNQIINSMSN